MLLFYYVMLQLCKHIKCYNEVNSVTIMLRKVTEKILLSDKLYRKKCDYTSVYVFV